MSVGYTSYGSPQNRMVGVDDPTLVDWRDATYDFDVAPRTGWLWSYFDDDPTNNGTRGEATQALLFTPLARGEKLIQGFDPDSHVLRFDLFGDYFGRPFVKIDSSDDFSTLLQTVADTGRGDSYVTVHQGDIIVRIDGDDCGLGDLRLTFDDLAGSVDLSGTLTVIDFDDFALAHGAEASLIDLNGGSNVYAGFEWSQAGIFNPAGDSQLGYGPASQPNSAFIGEKDGVDRPEYDGYDAPAGSPMEIYSADAFTFVSAAFNAVSYDSALVTCNITVQAFVDGSGAAVGEITFTVDNQGTQDVIEFSDPLDAQRFENVNRLVIDSESYFGMDDFTFV
ncbi:hypothetical protein SAMN04490244_11160 [Tranquillimonas rosea]|uniref:Uncharacterized protein n=1 Tax=Tranquillimonas rosea TaxID=641238 RepID=A0A1H9WL47_9RHOB|nr:hypothetical protein [Tranquillimonas rosea]SES34183.1 hypothetical protein SAMN04490244_11160 [Tranquillimonas rosea]